MQTVTQNLAFLKNKVMKSKARLGNSTDLELARSLKIVTYLLLTDTRLSRHVMEAHQHRTLKETPHIDDVILLID